MLPPADACASIQAGAKPRSNGADAVVQDPEQEDDASVDTASTPPWPLLALLRPDTPNPRRDGQDSYPSCQQHQHQQHQHQPSRREQPAPELLSGLRQIRCPRPASGNARAVTGDLKLSRMDSTLAKPFPSLPRHESGEAFTCTRSAEAAAPVGCTCPDGTLAGTTNGHAGSCLSLGNLPSMPKTATSRTLSYAMLSAALQRTAGAGSVTTAGYSTCESPLACTNTPGCADTMDRYLAESMQVSALGHSHFHACTCIQPRPGLVHPHAASGHCIGCGCCCAPLRALPNRS